MHQDSHHPHHHMVPAPASRIGHAEQRTGPHSEHHGHGAMVADFRRRFWVSLVLTVPILALSPSAGTRHSDGG